MCVSAYLPIGYTLSVSNYGLPLLPKNLELKEKSVFWELRGKISVSLVEMGEMSSDRKGRGY